MAEDEDSLHPHHAHETQHLTYGHFGTATYSNKTWAFLRDDLIGAGAQDDSQSARCHGSFTLLQERVIATVATQSSAVSNDSLLTKNNSNVISTGHHSDLGFVTEYLTSRNEPDAANTVPRGQAFASEVIACGSVAGPSSRLASSAAYSFPVVVYASSSDLELSELQSGTRDHDRFSNIHAGLRAQKVAHQLPTAQPVLQIAFSSQTGAASYLAVRKSSSITIMRPVHLRDSEPHLNHPESPRSTMRWGEVATIFNSHTGGKPYADLSFNPEDEQQIVVVDTGGHWSIWEITGKASSSARVLSRLVLIYSGYSKPLDLLDSGIRVPRVGWHGLCWLNDTDVKSSAILACRRNSAQLFDIRGVTGAYIDMRLGTGANRQVILDVKQLPRHSSMCVVLTSSSVMLMRLSSSSRLDDDQSFGEPIQLLCSWAHFRGSHDTTLRVRVMDLSRGPNKRSKTNEDWKENSHLRSIFQLVLFSRRNNEIDVYRVQISTSKTQQIATVGERLNLPKPGFLQSMSAQLFDVTFCVSDFDRPQSEADHVHAKLVKLIALCKDGTVIETVFRYEDVLTAEEPEDDDLAMMTTVTRRMKHVKSSAFIEEDEDDDFFDFVVKDAVSDSFDASHDQWMARLCERGVQSRAKTSIMSWSDVLEFSLPRLRGEQITEQVSKLRTQLSQHPSDITQGTTLDHLLVNVRVEDIEVASEAVTAFINEATSSDVQIKLLKRGDSITPTANYDLLVDGYVSSLVDDVPDRLRVNTERLARNVGLEIVLAHQVVHHRKPRPAQHAPRISSYDSSDAESSSMSRHNCESALSILSKYTAVRKLDGATSSSRSAREVLEHLPYAISSDPSDYSWQNAELKIAIARQPGASQQQEKLATRQRRKDVAQRQRQEQTLRRAIVSNTLTADRLPEDEMLRRAMPPNTGIAGPLLQTGAQSQRAPDDVLGSSQSTQGVVLAQSQPERGAHGHRDQKTVKRRLKGF